MELDPDDENIKARISVIYNEFGVNAYQDKNFPVMLVLMFMVHVILIHVSTVSDIIMGTVKLIYVRNF